MCPISANRLMNLIQTIKCRPINPQPKMKAKISRKKNCHEWIYRELCELRKFRKKKKKQLLCWLKWYANRRIKLYLSWVYKRPLNGMPMVFHIVYIQFSLTRQKINCSFVCEDSEICGEELCRHIFESPIIRKKVTSVFSVQNLFVSCVTYLRQRKWYSINIHNLHSTFTYTDIYALKRVFKRHQCHLKLPLNY